MLRSSTRWHQRMLKLVRCLKDSLLRLSTYAPRMSTQRSHSPPTPSSSTSTDEPVAKRQRIESGVADGESNGVNGSLAAEVPTKRKRTLPYEKGMHLAPMVRIGTLPVRLVCAWILLTLILQRESDSMSDSLGVRRGACLGS